MGSLLWCAKRAEWAIFDCSIITFPSFGQFVASCGKLRANPLPIYPWMFLIDVSIMRAQHTLGIAAPLLIGRISQWGGSVKGKIAKRHKREKSGWIGSFHSIRASQKEEAKPHFVGICMSCTHGIRFHQFQWCLSSNWLFACTGRNAEHRYSG